MVNNRPACLFCCEVIGWKYLTEDRPWIQEGLKGKSVPTISWTGLEFLIRERIMNRRIIWKSVTELIPFCRWKSVKISFGATGRKAFRTKELSAQIHSSRLSFAEPEYMLRYLDIEPGAVSVMGLMNDRGNAVRLLIDEEVLKDEFIGCHPCVCTSSLKLKTKDLTERFLPATGHPFQIVQLKGKE